MAPNNTALTSAALESLNRQEISKELTKDNDDDASVEVAPSIKTTERQQRRRSSNGGGGGGGGGILRRRSETGSATGSVGSTTVTTNKSKRRASFAQSDVSSETGTGGTRTISSGGKRDDSEHGTGTSNGGTRKRRSSLFSSGRRDSDAASTLNNDNNNNFWSKMANKESVWEDCDGDDDDDYDFDDYDTKKKISLACKNMCSSCKSSIKLTFTKTYETIRAHPHILLVTILLFGILCATSVSIVMKFANDEEEKSRDEAYDIATETGHFFSNELDGAIVPLFSMAQFVQQLDIFHDLPNKIGMANTPGAIPFKPPSTKDSDYTHRNVTGICDEPKLLNRFNEIAADIKKNAGMEKVLVNVQLAPMAVMCLMYPLNNTEDFDAPKFLDNHGALGHDLLNDPKRKFISEATVPSKDVVIAGPLTLRQCPDCDATVSKTFIARLPINAPTDNQTQIVVDGVPYNKWGFTVALINWGELIDRSDVHDKFDHLGMKFRLTRTDTHFNETSQTYYDKIVELAVSNGGFNNFNEDEITSVELDTTNNKWTMEVAYDDGLEPSWKKGALAGVVVISFVISLLFMTILVEKQSHRDLLKELIPSVALRKLERGQTVVDKYDIATIFFSDIVGYTSLSATMRPIEVMKMLSEFYMKVDDLADKHGVYKIETIGDAYMATGGVPFRCIGPLGAQKVALFALDLIDLVENFTTSDGMQIRIRAGINSGPVVGGVIGRKKPQFTIFGDAVNAAARMESTSEKMRIQCSDMTYRLLQDAPTHTFHFEDRGSVEVKGKGTMHTWFINGATEGIIRPELKDIENSSDEEDSEDVIASSPSKTSATSTVPSNCTSETGMSENCKQIQNSFDNDDTGHSDKYLDDDTNHMDNTSGHEDDLFFA